MSDAVEQVSQKGKWYRCAYKFPHWKAGHSKWPDGFARTYWMSSKDDVESMTRITESQGGEAFVESRDYD